MSGMWTLPGMEDAALSAGVRTSKTAGGNSRVETLAQLGGREPRQAREVLRRHEPAPP